MKGIMHPCRSCGQTSLALILSLGWTPLANALLSVEELPETEETHPLDFVFCPNCTLVQITETVALERFFREHFYRYRPSIVDVVGGLSY